MHASQRQPARFRIGMLVAMFTIGVTACGLAGFAASGISRAGQDHVDCHRDACANAGRCILCNAYGASHAPRICSSCNNKFNNRCILCNAYGASIAPRICGSCNNKFNNRCILCNAYGANSLPRICTSCNNKH
jgi:hypothetical protein